MCAEWKTGPCRGFPSSPAAAKKRDWEAPIGSGVPSLRPGAPPLPRAFSVRGKSDTVLPHPQLFVCVQAGGASFAYHSLTLLRRSRAGTSAIQPHSRSSEQAPVANRRESTAGPGHRAGEHAAGIRIARVYQPNSATAGGKLEGTGAVRSLEARAVIFGAGKHFFFQTRLSRCVRNAFMADNRTWGSLRRSAPQRSSAENGIDRGSVLRQHVSGFLRHGWGKETVTLTWVHHELRVPDQTIKKEEAAMMNTIPPTFVAPTSLDAAPHHWRTPTKASPYSPQRPSRSRRPHARHRPVAADPGSYRSLER